MRVQEKWLEALMPEPVVIGGAPMHPLSYGHVLLLARFTGWEPMETVFPAEHIPLGLFVCSRDWRKAGAELGTRRARRFLGTIAETVRVPDAVRLWNEYLAGSLIPPSFRKQPKPSSSTATHRPPGAPFLLKLRLFAFSNLNASEDQLADMVLADLVWCWLAHGEELGEIRLVNDADLSLEEWAREQDAKREFVPVNGRRDLCQ